MASGSARCSRSSSDANIGPRGRRALVERLAQRGVRLEHADQLDVAAAALQRPHEAGDVAMDEAAMATGTGRGGRPRRQPELWPRRAFARWRPAAGRPPAGAGRRLSAAWCRTAYAGARRAAHGAPKLNSDFWPRT